MNCVSLFAEVKRKIHTINYVPFGFWEHGVNLKFI